MTRPSQPSAGDVDVVVVGAGITGLAAADLLVAAGLSVVVLEGRDRVGGRLHSITVDDDRITGLDLGATWFWPEEWRVAALVQRFSIPTFPQHLAGDAIYQETAGAHRLDGNPIDVSSGRFVAGAQGLAEAVAAALPPGTVQLNHPVGNVTASPTSMTVRGPFGAITAGQVVVAIPPALAVSTITFEPPLPERLAELAAVTPVWMGAVTKVVAVYREPFWRGRGLAGAAISHVGPMRELHDMSGPDGAPAALFGFVPAAGTGWPTVTEAAALEQLVELFGPEAARPAAVHITDWRNERLTSPPEGERLDAYQNYGHNLFQQPSADGRLHIASTETATESPGHIEGALSAAERAARSIMEQRTNTTSGSDR